MKKKLLFFLLLLLLFPSVSFAHPGGTDKNGGHYNDAGYYHFHHGYPAHTHYSKICPYYLAEISYDTSYPWEFEYFLDKYVDGFDCGYDIGLWDGNDDGYNTYYKHTDFFDDEIEYDELDFIDDEIESDKVDYANESPFAYGYCDGYRTGYDIAFVETYNNEAIYNDDDSMYDDWFLEDVPSYAIYETVGTNTESLSADEETDLSIFEIVFNIFHYGMNILCIVICIVGFIHLAHQIR